MPLKNITSKENKELKLILKIINLKKFRNSLGKFFIEGQRLCSEALKSNVEISEFFCTERRLEKNKILIKKFLDSQLSGYILPEHLFKKLSDTINSQGILCVCNKLKNFVSLKNLCKTNSKIIILENIQDPLNFGTILRTAETLGINRIILSENCCNIYNPKALRGSMGSVFRMFFYLTKNLKSTILELKENFNVPVYASTLSNDSVFLTGIEFPKCCAVAIGNEGNGLSNEVISVSSFKVKIPISKNSNSLNASSAASIIMWELMRNTYK